jgi:membrane protein DedA with SNARE-associated domain
MSFAQAALLLAVVTGSLLEGEVVIVGFAVLAAAPSFPLRPLEVGAAGLAGTLLGDQAVYWIGRLVPDPSKFRFRRRPLLTDERRRHLERFFRRHGPKTVFFLRYAFGLRTVGYFSAGALGMRWGRFALADLAGAASWVAVLVALGYGVGRPVLRLLRDDSALLFLAVPVTAALVALVIWVQRRFEER